MIMHLTQSEVLYVIELYAPNSRENDSNEKEEKSRYKNAAVILLFGLTELPLPIIGIELVSGSSHGNEGEHNVSENESDTYECSFAADEEHSRKKSHQNTCDKERVCQDLEIDCHTIREKALRPNHEKSNQQFNTDTDSIFD